MKKPPPNILGPRDALWIGILLILAAVALAYVEASGHGADAQWIMDNHPECCGEEDCEPAMGMVTTRVGSGGLKSYSVKGMNGEIPEQLVRESEDGLPWACKDLTNNYLRCLFLPATDGMVHVDEGEVDGWSQALTRGSG